jgi:transposase
MAYSLDFRKQVFQVKQKEKLTFQEVSDRFRVPIRTLLKWQKRIIPKTKPNKPSTKLNLKT